MQDDFDLDGLSPAEAREYVARFITARTQAQHDLAAREEELELWKKRVRLATGRGETDLARESLARAEEVHARLPGLRKEARDLDFKVTELKRRLTELERRPELSVNAGALLEQLESLVGTDHETRDALADAEAEVALEELRRRMAAEDGQQEKGE